jgi:hypothetical protein
MSFLKHRTAPLVFALVIAVVWLGSQNVVQAAVVYDAAQQFDPSNNPSRVGPWQGVWSYATSDTQQLLLLSTQGTYNGFPSWSLSSPYDGSLDPPFVWKNTGTGQLNLTVSALPAIVRFTAPSDGIYVQKALLSGAGNFYPLSGTTGTVLGASSATQTVFSLKSGDTVDAGVWAPTQPNQPFPTFNLSENITQISKNDILKGVNAGEGVSFQVVKTPGKRDQLIGQFVPGDGLTLQQAAAALGYNGYHFNWIQWVTSDSSPTTSRPKFFDPGTSTWVPQVGQRFLDPPPHGWDYEQKYVSPNPGLMTFGDDAKPGYLNEDFGYVFDASGEAYAANTTTTDLAQMSGPALLQYYDSPSVNGTATITTYLAAVDPSGLNAVVLDQGYQWSVEGTAITGNLISFGDLPGDSSITSLEPVTIADLTPADFGFLASQGIGVDVPEPSGCLLVGAGVAAGALGSLGRSSRRKLQT